MKHFICCLLLGVSMTLSWSVPAKEDRQGFGAASVDRELFDYIRSILPDGKTMLELGSGWATGEFARYYTVYSIENDPKWVGRYNSHYIYAPIINGWYDVTVLQQKLPREYDLILVDGPLGRIGRDGFFTYLYLFNTDVPIIFDDINRPAEYQLMINVATKIQRPYEIYTGRSGKQFGVVQ